MRLRREAHGVADFRGKPSSSAAPAPEGGRASVLARAVALRRREPLLTVPVAHEGCSGTSRFLVEGNLDLGVTARGGGGNSGSDAVDMLSNAETTWCCR
jgi:hypothetical protein